MLVRMRGGGDGEAVGDGNWDGRGEGGRRWKEETERGFGGEWRGVDL